MPTLSPELDGHVGAAPSAWNTLLTADGGKSFDSTTDIASGTAGASSVNTSEFGAYRKREAFFQFDCSSITSTVSSAVLKIYIDSVSGAQVVRGYKGTFSGTVSVNYFNDFNTSIPYTNAVESQAGGYKEYILTPSALSDLESENDFKIVMVDDTYVPTADVPPNGTLLVTNYKFSEDADHPPELEYTLTSEIAGRIILTNRIQLTSGKIAL